MSRKKNPKTVDVCITFEVRPTGGVDHVRAKVLPENERSRVRVRDAMKANAEQIRHFDSAYYVTIIHGVPAGRAGIVELVEEPAVEIAARPARTA